MPSKAQFGTYFQVKLVILNVQPVIDNFSQYAHVDCFISST